MDIAFWHEWKKARQGTYPFPENWNLDNEKTEHSLNPKRFKH
jgi:hypothetical protein